MIVPHCLPTLRIKLFRTKMSLVLQKDKIKLDAWVCKSMLSFVKMKTHKRLGSAATRCRKPKMIFVKCLRMSLESLQSIPNAVVLGPFHLECMFAFI